MVITFGKYAGEEIGDVPISYLRWCEKNLTNAGCKNQISAEITRRTGKTKSVRMADDPLVSPTNGKPYPKCLYNKTLRKAYESALKRGAKEVLSGRSSRYQICLQDGSRVVEFPTGYSHVRDFENVCLEDLWIWGVTA